MWRPELNKTRSPTSQLARGVRPKEIRRQDGLVKENIVSNREFCDIHIHKLLFQTGVLRRKYLRAENTGLSAELRDVCQAPERSQ
jgi:hypothetical protein